VNFSEKLNNQKARRKTRKTTAYRLLTMTWRKGQSGNPLGAPKRAWLADATRFEEARKTWHRLLAIRDGLILERQQIRADNGEMITVDVTPSVRDLIIVCDKILDRAIGKAIQPVAEHHSGIVVHEIKTNVVDLIEDPTSEDESERKP
jgi:hypothetical protein